MDLKRHIFLIGFMGSGKSTDGRTLAEMTGADLIEMDDEIRKDMNMEITEIFDKYGEPYFRELETDLLRDIRDRAPAIVSCGGGAVLKSGNAAIMKEKGVIVLLDATPETIYERVCDSTDRPVLNGNMNVEYITDLMDRRRPAYEEAADITVVTDFRSSRDICEEILRKVSSVE